jgi:hypothetical protein
VKKCEKVEKKCAFGILMIKNKNVKFSKPEMPVNKLEF